MKLYYETVRPDLLDLIKVVFEDSFFIGYWFWLSVTNSNSETVNSKDEKSQDLISAEV